MPLHAWDYIVKVQERKIILSVSTKLLKIPSQIRRQHFWEVSSCRLPKVVQNLIIFSKVVNTWVDSDAKFTRLSCTPSNRWDLSVLSWDMATICRGNHNAMQPSILIFKLAVSCLWFHSRDWLRSLSQSRNTESVEAILPDTYHSAVFGAPALIITCFVLIKC